MEFHFVAPSNFEDMRERYQESIIRRLDNGDLESRPLPPYVLPDDVERIELEVHQTGETYTLQREEDEWTVTSKRKRVVKMKDNEYRMDRLAWTPANLYYWVRYDVCRS